MSLVIEDCEWVINIPVLMILDDKNIITIGSWGWFSQAKGGVYMYAFIRNDRWSYELLHEVKKFTLSLVSNTKTIMKMGTLSGRNINKFSLIKCFNDGGYVYPKKANIVYFCDIVDIKYLLGYALVIGKLINVLGNTKGLNLSRWVNKTSPKLKVSMIIE